MLSQEQRDTFRRALASWNHLGATVVDIDDVLSDEQIVETRESIDDFFAAHGRRLDRNGNRPAVPHEQEKTPFGTFFRWERVQARAGLRRGDLFVMDFGDARACYFSGEQP